MRKNWTTGKQSRTLSPSPESAFLEPAQAKDCSRGKALPKSIGFSVSHRSRGGHCRSLSLCRQSIVEKLRSGESVLDALKRLGSPDVPGGGHEGLGPSSKAGRLADMRSRLAGTVPTENRCSLGASMNGWGTLLKSSCEVFCVAGWWIGFRHPSQVSQVSRPMQH